MNKTKGLDFIKRYTMILVLIVVTAFFAWRTGGAILLPMNVSSLISQNAYVFILATGMLLCILTGGNIDLSVGSVVCFVGAIGAVLMVNMKMNMWLAILIMFVIGTLIGAFQGFWIAYVRIPPFIVTLAGMLAFRGLSNVVLQGMTVSIKDCTTFVNLFGGGADCYIPDFFGNGPINLTCVFAGVIAAVIFAVLQLKNRADKVKKGYEAPSMGSTIGKIVVIAVVILAFSYRRTQRIDLGTDCYHGIRLHHFQHDCRTLFLRSGRYEAPGLERLPLVIIAVSLAFSYRLAQHRFISSWYTVTLLPILL